MRHFLNSNRLPLLAVSIFALAFLSFLAFFYYDSQNSLRSEVSASIGKGVGFLSREQMDYGEFRTLVCGDILMESCGLSGSHFATSFVLYSLRDLQGEKVNVMKEKAVRFLLAGKEDGGVWRYLMPKNAAKQFIPADLDDTAVASFALRLNGVQVNNTELILQSRDANGLFLTWLEGGHPEFSRDLDCVVNANVLLYLGKNDARVCSYINKAILSSEKCAAFYPDDHPARFALFYSVSRAYANNVTCFGESRDAIIDAVLSHAEAYGTGSFGSPFRTALALSTLQDLGYQGKEVEAGVRYLLSAQAPDGSWRREAFFFAPAPYYAGSDELTTAFAIDALNMFSKGKSGKIFG